MRRVLFVCLGNICRSPAAEGVFRKMVQDQSLTDKIEIDSAGTSAVHAGEAADSRMREHASKRGYQLDSISRQFLGEQDFNTFDYIVVMDESNYGNVLATDTQDIFSAKVSKLTDYCHNQSKDHVPDPYYGGAKGFEEVMDIVEDGCRGLLERVKQDL